MKKYLLVFLISMIPIVELRGAIPIAAAKGLPFGWTYALTVLGNMLPVPFILLLIPVLFAFMRRHHILVGLVDWLERKAEKGAKKMEKRAGKAATAETETADAPAASRFSGCTCSSRSRFPGPGRGPDRLSPRSSE